MPKVRFPLVGSFTNRNENASTFSADDQVFINCYPELNNNPITGKASADLYKRTGFTTGGALTSVSAAGAVGAIVSSVTFGVAAGFRNVGGSSSVWDLITSSKIGGDIASADDVVAIIETTIGGTDNLVAYIDDTAVIDQYYFPDGGSWTKVTDGDFPTDAVGFPAALDGYIFNMTARGRIYNSDLNSVSSYGATSFITCDISPDGGITVARQGNKIVGFGSRSIEFFENAGNAFGSPLRRIGALQMGAANRLISGHHTVLPLSDTIYFVGTDSSGAYTGVYKLEGLQPKKISNPAIDKLFGSAVLQGFVGKFSLHAQTHIAVQGTSGVYCFAEHSGLWWKFLLASGEVIAIDSTAPAGNVTGANSYFMGSNNARANQLLAAAVYQDNGSNYTMTARTDSLDFGTDRTKFFKKMRVSYDVQSSSSNLGISWSDDDHDNYTTAVNIDMSQSTGWITRLGSSRRRSFQFTNTANTPCRIRAVEIDYEEGSH